MVRSKNTIWDNILFYIIVQGLMASTNIKYAETVKNNARDSEHNLNLH